MSESIEKLFYKIIGDNYGNFPYHLGLNSLEETKEEFNPEPTCRSGGLYYTTIEHILEYLHHGDKLCILSVPNSAR